jgi:hypothetical protein
MILIARVGDVWENDMRESVPPPPPVWDSDANEDAVLTSPSPTSDAAAIHRKTRRVIGT